MWLSTYRENLLNFQFKKFQLALHITLTFLGTYYFFDLKCL